MFSTKSVPYNHKNFDRSEIGSNFATRNETKHYRLQQYRQFYFNNTTHGKGTIYQQYKQLLFNNDDNVYQQYKL